MEDKIVQGAEGIVLHNGNFVFGMQKPKRWYSLEDGGEAAIIKTLGGAIEKEDKSTRETLIREIKEELEGVKSMSVSTIPIFRKRILMGELNPYENQSDLQMVADFYLVRISGQKIFPRDLPALVEVPLIDFTELKFAKNDKLSNLTGNILSKPGIKLPQNYAFMVPEEVRDIIMRTTRQEKKGEECER